MKVKMYPHVSQVSLDNGLGRVVQKYFEYLPQVGIELVEPDATEFDLIASHAGAHIECDIHHNHGLYWSSYAKSDYEQQANLRIAKSAVHAKAITVPSNWVGETFKRDMRIMPYVVPHGVEFEEWQHSYSSEGYVLWNKNRTGDACDVTPVSELARRFMDVKFFTTFGGDNLPNVNVTGKLPFEQMQPLIQKSRVYLAVTKETFGIGTLEALASGIPVLGFNWGGTADIVTHQTDGYLVDPYDYASLARGLEWLLDNDLTANCKQTAKQYDWLTVAKQLKEIYESVCI